jgi:hypothetical protein
LFRTSLVRFVQFCSFCSLCSLFVHFCSQKFFPDAAKEGKSFSFSIHFFPTIYRRGPLVCNQRSFLDHRFPQPFYSLEHDSQTKAESNQNESKDISVFEVIGITGALLGANYDRKKKQVNSIIYQKPQATQVTPQEKQFNYNHNSLFKLKLANLFPELNEQTSKNSYTNPKFKLDDFQQVITKQEGNHYYMVALSLLKSKNHNITTILELFEQAASVGHTKAAFNAGLIYEHSNTVKAQVLYKQAANDGFARAQFRLAMMLLRDVRGRDGFREAVRWLKEAKAQGFEKAFSVLVLLDSPLPV